MKQSRLLFGCLCLLTAYSPGLAQQAPTNTSDLKLIQDLESPKFRLREQAMQKLLARGAEVLPALNENLSRLDAEGQSRAQILIGVIRDQAANAKLIESPKVRFQFANTPLVDAIGIVNSKTGLHLEVNDQRSTAKVRSITLDTQELPVWEAVEKFLIVAGLTDSRAASTPTNPNGMFYSGTRTVRFGASGMQPNIQAILLADGKREAVSDLRTSFRIQALPTSSPLYKKSLGDDVINLGVEAHALPSVGMRTILGIDVLYAEDEKGQQLKQKLDAYSDPSQDTLGQPGQIVAFGGGFGGGNIIINNTISDLDMTTLPLNQKGISLRMGKSRSSELKILRGILHAVVVQPEAPIMSFSDLSKLSETPSRGSGFSFRITEAVKDKKGSWTIRCNYECTNATEFLGWNAANAGPDSAIGGYDFSSTNGLPKITFLDQNGKPFRRTAQNIVGQNFMQNGNGMSLQSDLLLTVLPDGEQELKQIVLSGRKVATTKVPFELRNVPLP